MEQLLLGIDIGTSGTKVAVFATDGTELASHTEEYPMYQPQNGWAEQDPEDWWKATVTGVRSVISGLGTDHEVVGVGLSGQMHGLVMLDDEGEILRPSIIWCDGRTEAECQQMIDVIGLERLIEITANPPMIGYTAAKILWVKNNEPDVYSKCAHILLPKDYIRYKLTGEFISDVSDASGMQLMDVPSRTWSAELCEKLGIDLNLLPLLVESQDAAGHVNAAAAALTGLASGTVLAGGAGDNPAAAIGSGVNKSGVAFTTIGSSAVIYAVSDKPRIDMEGRINTLCASVPGMWTVMSCTQGAGLSLKWLRDTVCNVEVEKAAELGVDSYVVMGDLAEAAGIGAGKLVYLPYLMGERSPHPDPDARGVFFGLSGVHDRSNLIRSVMEGVAYSQKECFDVFTDMGVQINDMVITGGGAKSKLWRQMLADLYAIPVGTLAKDSGAALGVALLAGVASGVYASLEEAVDRALGDKDILNPSEERGEAYKPYFELYKNLYRTLITNFKDLTQIK
ncbi:MAG: xylulokinase [Clostridiales Family XIII bacterium]|jgi:xylulokinase|nr:xylulokinase [Clostridiales Family XIII bacterium]